MSVSCASRFSVLKVEDDDYYTDSSDDGLKRKPKTFQSKSDKSLNDNKTKAKKKKKKPTKENNDQSNEPSSNLASKPNKSSSRQPKSSNDNRQWEEWMQKDAEFVSDTYESDLQQALLLSKLEFEEKKEFYEAIRLEEEEKATKKKKKKAKPVLTLNELNAFHEASASSAHSKGDSSHLPENCENFFDQIDVATEEIINKEIRDVARRKSEPFEVEKIRTIEFQDQLQEKDKEIGDLKEELASLKKELETTKHKKKLFAKLLKEGEMHEKATLLVQLEQMTKLKDDLTEQMTELHTALEQERSKVHALQTELKKYQNKRKDERRNSQKES